MRVLHLAAGKLYGGTETQLATLARCRGLCPEMEPRYAVCFEGRLSEELRSAGAAVAMLGPTRVRRPWTVWAARRRLRALAARDRPDVVVSHGCWTHAVLSPAARPTPVVFHAHDLPTGRPWLEWWAKRHPPRLVLANSRTTREAMPCLFPQTPCEVFYPPVACPAADQDAGREELRRALGAPPGAAVIVAACRMEPWKGHALLLEALGLLRDAPGWVCWVAGGAQRPHEEAYLARLKRQAERAGIAGRVRWLGQRRDVPRLLAAADIHCQPNQGPEPFGNGFIEALYAGLPVVTTDMGGGQEIVDETCGILVPPGDAVGLAQALRELIGDLNRRAALGQRGSGRASSLSDPRSQLNLLHRLLAGACFHRNPPYCSPGLPAPTAQ